MMSFAIFAHAYVLHICMISMNRLSIRVFYDWSWIIGDTVEQRFENLLMFKSTLPLSVVCNRFQFVLPIYVLTAEWMKHKIKKRFGITESRSSLESRANCHLCTININTFIIVYMIYMYTSSIIQERKRCFWHVMIVVHRMLQLHSVSVGSQWLVNLNWWLV